MIQRTTMGLLVAAAARCAGCHYTDYSVDYRGRQTRGHVEKCAYAPAPLPSPPPPVYYERHEYHQHYYH